MDHSRPGAGKPRLPPHHVGLLEFLASETRHGSSEQGVAGAAGSWPAEPRKGHRPVGAAEHCGILWMSQGHRHVAAGAADAAPHRSPAHAQGPTLCCFKRNNVAFGVLGINVSPGGRRLDLCSVVLCMSLSVPGRGGRPDPPEVHKSKRDGSAAARPLEGRGEEVTGGVRNRRGSRGKGRLRPSWNAWFHFALARSS